MVFSSKKKKSSKTINFYSYLFRSADNNSHNDTIDSDSLTENDTNQIFGTDTWSFNPTAQDAATSCINSPVRRKGTSIAYKILKKSNI